VFHWILLFSLLDQDGLGTAAGEGMSESGMDGISQVLKHLGEYELLSIILDARAIGLAGEAVPDGESVLDVLTERLQSHPGCLRVATYAANLVVSGRDICT
jgi:hypothetical protein